MLHNVFYNKVYTAIVRVYPGLRIFAEIAATRRRLGNEKRRRRIWKMETISRGGVRMDERA